MKIGVVGLGYLGNALVNRGVYPIDCDITKPVQLKSALWEVDPDILINCAAMTNVDWCEEHPVEALQVNARGVMNLLDVFKGKLFIQMSTDHVFSGKKLYQVSEKNGCDPVNMYGTTKLAGEFITSTYPNTIIVRTSKLFSWETLEKDLLVLDGGMPMEITDLIKRSFVHVEHFIDGLLYVISQYENMPKLLHIAGTDTMSYAHFWSGMCEVMGFDKSLIHYRRTEIKATPRPFRGGLSVNLAGRLGVPLYSAYDGMKLIAQEMAA